MRDGNKILMAMTSEERYEMSSRIVEHILIKEFDVHNLPMHEGIIVLLDAVYGILAPICLLEGVNKEEMLEKFSECLRMRFEVGMNDLMKKMSDGKEGN
jgi:hypothetical protein